MAANYFLKKNIITSNNNLTILLKQNITNNTKNIKQTQQSTKNHISTITIHITKLQTHLIHLNTLNKHLINITNLKNKKFKFSKIPTIKKPKKNKIKIKIKQPNFLKNLNQLTSNIKTHKHQLKILKNLLKNHKIQKKITLTNKPIT